MDYVVRTEFQLIADCKHVRRLHPCMDESFVMQISQRIEKWREHFADFAGGERSLGQNLRQILVRKFEHDIEKRGVVESASSRVENAKQMWMRQLGCLAPLRKLTFRIRSVGSD